MGQEIKMILSLCLNLAEHDWEQNFLARLCLGLRFPFGVNPASIPHMRHLLLTNSFRATMIFLGELFSPIETNAPNKVNKLRDEVRI